MPSAHPPLDPAPDIVPTPPNPAVRVDEEHIFERDLREWRSRSGRALVELFRSVVGLVAVVFRRWGVQATAVLTLVVGGGVALWIASGAAEVYEGVQHAEGVAALDQPVLDWAASTRTPTTSVLVTDYTDIGGPVGGVVLSALVLVVLVLVWRRWTPAVLLLAGLAGSLLVTVVGKDVTGRARPPHELAVPPFEASASFPSGHTLNATVLAGLTAYLLLIMSRRVWLGVVGVLTAAAYAVSMGLSRVWLGHHWLTDVIAGWLLGIAWVLLVITVHRLVLTLRSHHPAHPPRD